jgi:hypothetical protein
VKEFVGLRLAGELLHLPGKPAGVEEKKGEKKAQRLRRLLADELLHLPDKPAGVEDRHRYGFSPESSCRRAAPGTDAKAAVWWKSAQGTACFHSSRTASLPGR